MIAAFTQHAYDLRLRSGRLFLREQRAEEAHEIEPVQSGQPGGAVDVLRQLRDQRDMRQHLRNRAGCRE